MPTFSIVADDEYDPVVTVPTARVDARPVCNSKSNIASLESPTFVTVEGLPKSTSTTSPI